MLLELVARMPSEGNTQTLGSKCLVLHAVGLQSVLVLTRVDHLVGDKFLSIGEGKNAAGYVKTSRMVVK